MIFLLPYPKETEMTTEPTNELLIVRLNERAHDPKRAADEVGTIRDEKGRPVPRVAAPPATEEQVAAAEKRLAFGLPPLLRQVYQGVGNGGFGPGAGLFGLPTSPNDEKDSAAGRYFELRRTQTKPLWPSGLLPLCDWGGGIGSFVDCTLPDAPVIRLDPNMPRADVGMRVPAPKHYVRASQVGAACWVESPSLSLWLEAWADGQPLFYLAYGGPDDTEDEEDDEEDDG